MPKRYQKWNGTDTIHTPSGNSFTAEEWASQYGWYSAPGAIMIISQPPMNGKICMEYTDFVEHYRQRGANIPDDIYADVDAVLDAIEACEDAEKLAAYEAAQVPTPEERIASALELQTLMAE